MLAFRGLERDENGSFTDDTETGADMEHEFQSAVIDIRDMLTAFFEARVKAARKPQSNG